ncbi:flagellar assembly protein A [Desulfoluna butyratoxydans]|uniref:Flagellar assembly protein a n=1 Tax=Desulfoluna butyratoxydans TaxID=231438 RepID=A0A4U8YPQ8_9BACT|nr:flagellar assembly protein A [Desulfoluna butyratoxydans]VFQ45770.1 flagellar assembly protein a [Desulfoluna butyratoxydans]
MTDTGHAVIPLTEIPVSRREQAKADILESYLFSSQVHTLQTLTVTITAGIKPGEEKINALALLQLLQRFHLETVKISALIIHGVLAEEPFDESLYVPWDDDGLGRTVRLVSKNNDITLTVSGTLPRGGKSGRITRTFFDKGSNAGKILSDGRIDFREMLRYPSAKAGDLLLQVSLPDTAKDGLSHDGTPVQPPVAKEYPLKLGKNVEQVYITTDEGEPGYDVKASRDGVVITHLGPEGISAIDITDRIVVGDIDFSVGNIGSDVVCPVSMQAESVNEGFQVKVAGSVTIRTINGGHVESGKKATVDQMLPESHLISDGDVACRSVSSSTISCEHGTVSIQREAIDATIHAHRVAINTSAALLLNSHLHTCVADLDNVRVSGKNHLILGPGLFAKRDELTLEKRRINTALHELEETLNKAKASLVAELKSLSAEFGEDESVRPVFKKIVASLKAYEFEGVPRLMASLKRGNTCLAVSGAMQTIEHTRTLCGRFWDLEAQAKALHGKISEVEEALRSISFSLNARLRPSAVIAIHLGSNDPAPLTLEAPPGSDHDHAVNIKGKFTVEEGLVTSQRSR